MARGVEGIGHRIANISYQGDYLECTCGATMHAEGGVDWAAHRRVLGLTLKSVGQTIGKRLRGGSTVQSHVWR